MMSRERVSTWVGRLSSALALAALACSGAQDAPSKEPRYLRSPTLDYQDPPRSASDGEVMGAHRQAPSETLEASPTNEKMAPGWEIRNGTLVASPEARQRGHGSHEHEPGCEPAERVRGSKPADEDKKKKEGDPGARALRPVCPEHDEH